MMGVSPKRTGVRFVRNGWPAMSHMGPRGRAAAPRNKMMEILRKWCRFIVLSLSGNETNCETLPGTLVHFSNNGSGGRWICLIAGGRGVGNTFLSNVVAFAAGTLLIMRAININKTDGIVVVRLSRD